MSDSSGQGTDRFHFLGLHQLLTQSPLLRLGILFFRNITDNLYDACTISAFIESGMRFNFQMSIQLRMERYATGLSDFDASTFINNPSWESMGTVVNPSGVAELGAVRITFQVDRMSQPRPNYLESVQTIMFRPRN